MDVGTFWMYFFAYMGAFWWESRAFWWNFVIFDGILGKFGDILGYLSVDLHGFGGIYADFWAILMGF